MTIMQPEPERCSVGKCHYLVTHKADTMCQWHTTLYRNNGTPAHLRYLTEE